MSETAGFQILSIGLDSRGEKFIESCFTSGGTLVTVSNVAQFENQYDTWQDDEFAGIFCSSNIPELSGAELAQSLQNQCPRTNKYFITFDMAKFEPSILLKNGFTNAFCLPQDKDLLIRTINEEILSAFSKKRALRPVKIFDIGADEKLDFGTFVFLPLNNKFIPFSSADQPISESRIEKLSKHQVGSLFIDHKDMNKFYQYSANRLRDASGSGMGTTERQEKLENQVRGLFNSIFDQSVKTDFAGGKEMVQNCQNIISNFISKGTSNDWYARLLASVGEQADTYNHASRVSTFASLFGIGIDHPHPEDLAMAGMFHDIGLVDIPDEITNKPEAQWTLEEKTTYYTHPEKSLLYLKLKRISLPPEVEKAIAQHHEKFNGKGFPKGVAADRISVEAQILSYADQFDYFTSIQAGRKALSPPEAHLEIAKTQSIGMTVLQKIGQLINEKKPAAS